MDICSRGGCSYFILDMVGRTGYTKADILQCVNNGNDVEFLTNEKWSNRGTIQLYMWDSIFLKRGGNG